MSESSPVTYGVIRHVFEPALTVEEFEQWVATKPDFQDDWGRADTEQATQETDHAKEAQS